MTEKRFYYKKCLAAIEAESKHFKEIADNAYYYLGKSDGLEKAIDIIKSYIREINNE